MTAVTLTAAASGGSAESTVRCNIVVDGVEVANKSSQFTCEAEVDFAKLAAVRSAQPPTPSATPSATPALSPAPPPAAPSPAVGCGYVTDDEMLAAVTDNFTAMTPSISSHGDATSCHYQVGGAPAALTRRQVPGVAALLEPGGCRSGCRRHAAGQRRPA